MVRRRGRGPPQSPSPSLNPKNSLAKFLHISSSHIFFISRHDTIIFKFLDMTLFYIFIFLKIIFLYFWTFYSCRHVTFFVLQWRAFSVKKKRLIFFQKKMFLDTRDTCHDTCHRAKNLCHGGTCHTVSLVHTILV